MEVPELRCIIPHLIFDNSLLKPDLSLTFIYCAFVVKERPKLKSRYKERVQVAIRHAKTIDDFDDLIDPRTLARHFLGSEPSPFVLRANEIEEKSEFCFGLFFNFFFT